MSDWSSFKDAKRQSDAFKRFLNESVAPKETVEIPLDEFFMGAKAKSGGKYGLSYDKNQYTDRMVCEPADIVAGKCGSGDKNCAPNCPPEEYNADDVVALNKALDDINQTLGLKIDRQALYDELEMLITDPKGNNYTIQEAIHKSAVILGRMPFFGPDGTPDPSKYPNLTKLFQGAVTNDKTREHLHKILARAGFFGAEGDQVPDWIKKTQPAQEPQAQDADAPAQDADGDGQPDAPAQPGEEAPAEGEKITVMWPKVQARTQKLMGNRWDAKKVRLVMQALSRLNKNPNIEFTWNAQIGEEMDLTAAYKLLAKSKDATGIDQQFMKDVVQAIMDVSGVQIRDFNLQGNVMTKLGPGKAQGAGDPDAIADLGRPELNGLANARNLEEYGEVYEKLQKILKPDGNTWEEIMGELESGGPDHASTAISAFGVDRDENNRSPHQIKFIELATAHQQDQEVTPVDAEEIPDEEETEYEIGKGPPGVMEPPPDEQAAEEEPGEEEAEETNEYTVATLSAFPRIKKAWQESDPPPGATFPADMAAFIDFIGPYAAKAKESGVLKDPTMSENVIQQLVGRPGGEDNEAWRQSPFMRIGNRGAIGKEMAMKLKKLPSNKAGNGKRDRVQRVLNVVLGPGGRAPSHKLVRDEFLNLLGMVKPNEQKPKEEPKEEPQQKAPGAEAPTPTGKSFGARTREKGDSRRAQAGSRVARAGSGAMTEENATLNESKTIDRWKTIAGIK